jgi:hypothetical protein
MLIEEIIQASTQFLDVLAQLEDAEGVMNEELESRFDGAVAVMANTSDSLANTLDYLDVAIGAAKEKKLFYEAKIKRLTDYKNRLRDQARGLMLQGIEFEGNERSVKLVPRTKYDASAIAPEDWPEEFVKIERSLKKADLVNAIKNGKVQPPKGFNITTEYSLRVS